jgi:hypothetical protein
MAICLSGLLAYWALAIWPARSARYRLERQIAEVQDRLTRRQALQPTYERVKGLLRAADARVEQGLPPAGGARLSREQIQRLPWLIGEVASRLRLEVDTVQLDFDGMVSDTDRQRLDLRLRGDLERFRAFILDVARRVPALDTVERLEIRSLPGTAELELGLRLCFTKESGR